MQKTLSVLIKVRKQFKTPSIKQYYSNTLWMLIDKVGTLGLSFVVGIFVARILGPGDYGLLGYAQSVAVFFSILAGLGLDLILKRNLVNEADRFNLILGTALGIRLWGAFGSIFLYGLIAYFTKEEPQTILIILIIILGNIFQSFSIIEIYFQSRLQSRLPVIAKLVQFVFSNLVRVYLIYIHAPVIWFAYALLFNEVINALGLLFIYQKQGLPFFKWKFQLGYGKELLKDSWPLILSGFVVVFYMRIDQIMIKHMMGNEAAGIYSVAIRFSDLWGFLPGVLGSAFYPAILNAKKKGEAFYLQRLQLLFDGMVWITVGIIIPFTYLIGKGILVAWYGESYREAEEILIIYVWSGVFAYLGTAVNLWLISENLQKHSLYRTLIGAVINVLLNLWLIPLCGIKGAAIATLISQAFASYFSTLLSRRTWMAFHMQTKALLFYSAFIKGKELFKPNLKVKYT